MIQCKLRLLCGLTEVSQYKICIKIYKNRWIGNVLACDLCRETSDMGRNLSAFRMTIRIGFNENDFCANRARFSDLEYCCSSSWLCVQRNDIIALRLRLRKAACYFYVMFNIQNLRLMRLWYCAEMSSGLPCCKIADRNAGFI